MFAQIDFEHLLRICRQQFAQVGDSVACESLLHRMTDAGYRQQIEAIEHIGQIALFDHGAPVRLLHIGRNLGEQSIGCYAD